MKDNELIAEFMGVPKLTDKNGFVWDVSGTGKGIYGLHSKYLRYNEKWDWLMPVVEKIEKLHSEKFHYDFEKISKGEWPQDKEYMDVIALPLSTPIDEVYKAVIEFINWYNTQNSGSVQNKLGEVS